MDIVATYSLVPRMESETVVSFGKVQVTSRDHDRRTWPGYLGRSRKAVIQGSANE